MEKGLISIIVPVFNVERYLDQCIKSVIKQSYTNWELILVDDGSYDNSYKICKNYERQDERIRVIRQENLGAGKARNAGLSVIDGEYVTFIDSDDFVKESYLEELYQALVTTNSDIAIGDYYILEDSKFIFYESKKDYGVRLLSKKELELKLPILPKFTMTWGKLFKVSLFKYIRLRSGYLEDREMATRLYLMATKVALVTNELYCYRQREGSVMHEGLSFKKMYDFISANDSMLLTYALAKLDDRAVRDSLVRTLESYRQNLIEKELTQTDLYREIMWRLKVIRY